LYIFHTGKEDFVSIILTYKYRLILAKVAVFKDIEYLKRYDSY